MTGLKYKFSRSHALRRNAYNAIDIAGICSHKKQGNEKTLYLSMPSIWLLEIYFLSPVDVIQLLFLFEVFKGTNKEPLIIAILVQHKNNC